MNSITQTRGGKLSFTVRSTNPNRWTSTPFSVVLSYQEDGTTRRTLPYVVGNTDVGQLNLDGSVSFAKDEAWVLTNLPAGVWEFHLYEGTSPQRAVVFRDPVYLIVREPTGGPLGT